LRKAHAELQERATKLAQAQDTASSSAAAEALRLRQERDALEQVRLFFFFFLFLERPRHPQSHTLKKPAAPGGRAAGGASGPAHT